MSIAHKNTGDPVTSINYNGIADAINGHDAAISAINDAMGAIGNNLFDSGMVTLVNGIVVVPSTKVRTTSRQITFSYNSQNGPLGILTSFLGDVQDGVSFTIISLNLDGTMNNLDNADVNWCVIL